MVTILGRRAQNYMYDVRAFCICSGYYMCEAFRAKASTLLDSAYSLFDIDRMQCGYHKSTLNTIFLNFNFLSSHNF